MTNMSTATRPPNLLSALTADTTLTKKAYLNAATVILEHMASLIVGFVLTPMMVRGLGNYSYGMWQILNRLVGYITPASGRPGFALKATLANRQASVDYDQKRRYVGSTLVIWVLFLPVLAGLGCILCWWVPYWVHAPLSFVWIVRVVVALLVLNMIVDTLASVPQVTLQGENLGYKRMGMSVVLIFIGGGLFTWLALDLKTGIAGIATAVVAKTILIGLFYLVIVRKYAPWFGAARPNLPDIHQMLGLSWWFMGANLVNSALMASDVVVLGLLGAVESVTSYTLTKNGPEVVIEAIVIIVYGITPGLGSIIGTRDHERVSRLRAEIMQFIWLFATAIGASLLIWNKVFVVLWVGGGHFSGMIPNLLIIVAAIQLTFIRSDSNMIDLTLRLRSKVLLGLLSVSVSISAASLAVGYFHLGIPGLCLGIIAGRAIISIGYPALVSRLFDVSLSSQFRGMIRPALISIVIFSGAVALESRLPWKIWSGLLDWLVFVASAGLTFALALLLAFGLGLTRKQQRNILRRLKAGMVGAPSSSMEPWS